MSISPWDIDNFARVLHSNGDKILNGCSKLSVNASLLHHVGVKLNDLSLNQPDNENFQVQRGNIVTNENVQFLHDFFQKTTGLKIVNDANLLRNNEKIDISKFKKLKYLEMKKVPVKHMIGLKVVQHQMECIVCERGLTTLEHLLAECGGDKSTGFVWSELKEAVLSFNDIKVVDSSVAFAPWLQVLDLSHNQIFDVNAIERLPNLKYVNLSYNSLATIPIFNKSARKKMEILILKNNYIDDIQALSGLDCLRELDLSDNLICSTKSFQSLLAMSVLQLLSFVGNPVCLSPKYRLRVIHNLHISASFGNFVLDGKVLSKREKESVGIELMSTSNMSETMTATDVPSETPVTEDCSGPSNVLLSHENKKQRKKSGKVRLAVIPNVDGTFDEIPEDTHVPYSFRSVSSTVHLETKKIIESVRAAHGDNWLRAQAAGPVTHMLGLPQTAFSSTPYDDSCLTAFLKSPLEPPATPTANLITTTAVIEPPPQHLVAANLDGSDTFLSCNEHDTTNYFSIEEEKQMDQSKETSPDVETIVDSDEDREANDESIYLALRVIREGSEIRKEELFLTVSETELKEKDPNNGRTAGSWSLISLESVTVVRDGELQLIFDTIRRDRRERCYEFDMADFTDFYNVCRSACEARQLAEKQPFCCVACSYDFLVDKKAQNREDSRCPACGSRVIVLQTKNDGRKEVRRMSSSPAPVVSSSLKKSHSRSASTGAAAGFPAQMSQCASTSSLGSSSDDQRNRLRGAHAPKSDSDIEIISNPSLSSIEVIDPPVPQAEPEGKVMLPALAAVVFSGLTESSSSGSITDSICTTYENSSMISSNVSKKSASSPLLEEPSETPVQKNSLIENNFKSLLQDVIDKVTEKVPTVVRRTIDKDVDSIVYSYTKFNELDHRIKLFIYAHLFDDVEQFRFLLRCQIMSSNDERCYNACLVFSDIKMYTLKVTGKEEGEEASKFFQRIDNLTVSCGDFRNWRTLPWNQGFAISYRSGYDKLSQLMVLFKDGVTTLNCLTFVKQFENMFPKCDWSKSSESDGASAMNQYLLSTGHGGSLSSFHGFFQCRLGVSDPLTTLSDGAFIITDSCLHIIDSLRWMLPSSKSAFPAPAGCQKISDLIQASVSDKELRLQFLDESAGKQEIWQVQFASEAILESVLADIASPWELLFSVPLEVCSMDDSF